MKQSELEMCIAEYGKDLYSFCCYLTYSKMEADDLYQDTFVTVIELGKIDVSNNPKSYRTILVSLQEIDMLLLVTCSVCYNV